VVQIWSRNTPELRGAKHSVSIVGFHAMTIANPSILSASKSSSKPAVIIGTFFPALFAMQKRRAAHMDSDQ